MLQLATVAATMLLVTSASAAKAVSTTVAYPQPTQSCVTGAHMIVARASEEPQGIGIIQGVTDMIQKMVPNSDAVAVVYPATEKDYVFSEQEGVVGMKQLVTDYVQKCPNGKIILLGYSQGAQVVGDTVIGSDEQSFSDDSTNPIGLGNNYLKNIAALIMMGDPAYKVGMPGSEGNATKSGLFARRNVDAFNQYGFNDKMQTYCNDGDLFCSGGSGKNALAIHLQYVNQFGSSAASYAASAFSGAGGAAAATGGSGSSSGAASASASPTTKGSSSNSGGSSSSKASGASSTAKATAASSMAGGMTSKAASAAGSKTTSMSMNDVLTSNRYHPYSGSLTARLTELGNLNPGDEPAPIPGSGGQHTVEKGIVGGVFGIAMFVMGLL